MNGLKITPGEWRAECVGDTGGESPVDVYEVTVEQRRVAEHLSEADARHIVHCVGLHDRLVTALGALLAAQTQINGSFLTWFNDAVALGRLTVDEARLHDVRRDATSAQLEQVTQSTTRHQIAMQLGGACRIAQARLTRPRKASSRHQSTL